MRLAIAGAAAALLSTGGYLTLPAEKPQAVPTLAVAAAQSSTLSNPPPVAKTDRTQSAAKGDAELPAEIPPSAADRQVRALASDKEPMLDPEPPSEEAATAPEMSEPAVDVCKEFAKFPLSQSIGSLEKHLQRPNPVNGVTLCFIRVALARINCMPVEDAVGASERQTRVQLAELLELPKNAGAAAVDAEIARVPQALRKLDRRQAFNQVLAAKAGAKNACDPAKPKVSDQAVAEAEVSYPEDAQNSIEALAAESVEEAGSDEPAEGLNAPEGQKQARVEDGGQRVEKSDDGCEPAESSKDRDLQRNAQFIRKHGLCLRTLRFDDNGLRWELQVVENQAHQDGPRWAVPHDNENAAFDTGVYAVARYGGRMVAVQAGEERILARVQDPNRAFGSGASCKALRRDSPRYTKEMVRLLGGNPKGHWFALHSNDDGHGGNGGQGHISALIKSADLSGFRSKEAKGGFADPDNAVMLSGLESAEDGAAQKWIARINGLGLNVIYEHVQKGRNDCSLSNYLLLQGRAGLGGYFNFEVEHGQKGTQQTMVDLVLGNLGYRPLSNKVARP